MPFKYHLMTNKADLLVIGNMICRTIEMPQMPDRGGQNDLVTRADRDRWEGTVTIEGDFRIDRLTVGGTIAVTGDVCIINEEG